MNDDIAKALDLVPIDTTRPSLPSPEIKKQGNTTIEADFEYARGSMINVIEKGHEALNDILELAGQSQQPRAYEVVATLVKTLSDANKDLLELTKRKADLTGERAQPATVNNNLFVGSTAELQKLIKKQQNGED
jgi:hypothetical protein